MKLSTAIRIGSMTTKQIRGRFHDGGNGRCAMGAAADACDMFIVPGPLDAQALLEKFPLLVEYIKHPLLSDRIQPLYHIIVSLNDHVGWTRDRIADWVETIENNLERAGSCEADAGSSTNPETARREPVYAVQGVAMAEETAGVGTQI